MTNELTDHLFSLLKSLSPSEKRQFSLYVGRIGVNTDSKFLRLFKVMGKQKKYDEKAVLKKTGISKKQLSNVKSHLYKQILTSLRLNPAQQAIPIQLREQLDSAVILYRKGLYQQSLKLLDKLKSTALYYEEKNLAYEILDLEKIIESQYITRSIENRAESLIKQTEALTTLNAVSSKLSNLSLQLYGMFLKMGYVRTEKEAVEIERLFHENLPEYDFSTLGFREKLWLNKAYLWYSFISQDFLGCYRYALKWNDLFIENPHLVPVHPVSYLKGNHYLLETLFYLNHTENFEKVLQHFEKTLDKPKIPKDHNIAALSFLYLYSNKLNLKFMKGEFHDEDGLVAQIVTRIEKYGAYLDVHHIMVFYYKIASLYFGAGNNERCIYFLDKIISNKTLKMREDLMCFSRILNLVAHYEAAKDQHLDRLVKSTYKFLIKMNDLHEVQKAMIQFLRHLPDFSPLDIKAEFKKLHTELKQYEDHPYERRAFLYLDILSWLESKIESKPVSEILARKAELVSR